MLYNIFTWNIITSTYYMSISTHPTITCLFPHIQLLHVYFHTSNYYSVMVGSVLLIFLVFYVYVCALKQCSVRLQLFVRGLMSYLHYLCLFVYSDVQHILCCVFVLFFFVLCILCCLFLWIVHF